MSPRPTTDDLIARLGRERAYLMESATTEIARLTAENERLREGHCQSCCCAQSWAALGITEYSGLSIPQHIESLRTELENARQAYSELRAALLSPAYETNHEGACAIARHYRERATKVIAMGATPYQV